MFRSNQVTNVLNVLRDARWSRIALGIQEAADEVDADRAARNGNRFYRLI